MNKVLVDGIRGSNMSFFQKKVLVDGIRGSNM
jgi:hypothetical protein